jgi:hypothetical protein
MVERHQAHSAQHGRNEISIADIPGGFAVLLQPHGSDQVHFDQSGIAYGRCRSSSFFQDKYYLDRIAGHRTGAARRPESYTDDSGGRAIRTETIPYARDQRIYDTPRLAGSLAQESDSDTVAFTLGTRQRAAAQHVGRRHRRLSVETGGWATDGLKEPAVQA